MTCQLIRNDHGTGRVMECTNAAMYELVQTHKPGDPRGAETCIPMCEEHARKHRRSISPGWHIRELD